MRIRKKLTLGYLLVAALVAVVGFLGLQAVRAISMPFDDVSRNSVPMVQVVDGLKFAGTRIVSATSEWALMESERAATAAAKNVKAQLYGAEAGEESEIRSGQLLYETQLKQYEALLKDEATPEAERLFERLRSSGEELQIIANQMVELKKASVSGRTILAKKEELEIAETNFLEAADSAIELENAEVKSDIASVDNKITAAIRIVAACVVLTLVVALVIGVFSARSIAEPLTRMKHASAQIGKGNLDSRLEVNSRDELGDLADSFNRMADDLKQSYIERKKQEHDLIVANTLLSTQQETSLDGILVVGENQEMISFNSRFVEMWQIPDAILETRSDKLALQSVLDTLESPEEFLNGVKYLYANKEIKLRDELKLKDGRTFDRYSAPMLGADDNYYGRVFYFRDVSERKNAEDELRKQKELLQKIFDHVPAMINFFDAEGRTKLVNREWERTRGWSLEEILKDDFDILAESYPEPAAREKVRLAISEANNGWAEFKTRNKDGSVIDTMWAIVPLSDGTRVGIGQDITERKRAEEEKFRLANHVQLLMDSTGEGIYGIDLQGKCTFMNRASLEMIGYEAEEALGKNMHDLIHHSLPDGSPYPVEECFIFRTFRNAMPCRVDNEVMWRRDGTSFPTEYSSFPIITDGVTQGAVVTFTDITGRKQSEQSLRESESRYRLLFETNPQPMWVYDVETFSFLAVNEAAIHHYGYSREEFLSMTIRDIRPPEDVPALIEAISNMNSESELTASSWRHCRRDGSIIDVEITAHTLNFAGRRAELVLSTDITERKRAEQALRESESRYKTLFDGATDSIMILDTERGKAGNIVAANQAAAKTTGYTSEELLKLNIAGLRTPLQASLVEDDFERVANGERLTFEILRRRKDGTTFPIEINASVLSIEGKRYILDFARDLTQRKQTETEVTMLAKAIRSIHEGVVVTDPSGTIIFVNDASVGMFGYERDEIVGKHVTTLVWANDAEFVHEVIARSKIEGWEGEALSRRKDGTIFPAYVSASDIHDENGNSVAIIGVCQDITERRRSMEELQNAKEEAEAASRAKSEFLANMSHEIRTPMNGIVGMTELALDTDLTAEQREYLKLVKLSADSLLRVINDILDFSKIEAGKLELELAEFSLQDTVDTVMKAMGVRADQKGLELAYYMRPGVPELIVGDEGRLRQILVNLVGNAIKFTDTGEVVMRVDVDAGDDEQVVLHFCVRDTGIGVPIEKQALIFDSFTQADGSTTRKYGGTGLGLAISAQLVRAMNGEIWIDSPALVGPPDEQINEANPGSMFHFTACFGVAQTSTALRTLLDLSTVMALPVLVVDDNATNRRILEVQLKNWNMKPVTAASASEAVNAIREACQARQPFELVLMDLHMPEVDGVELTAIIRQIPEAAGVKIIMMSSAVSENYSNQDFGVDAYLLKPVKASDLLGVIRSVLGKTAATQDGSKPLRSITSTHPARVLVAEDSPVNQELIRRLLAKWGHSAVIACNGKQALSFLEAENFDVVLMDVQMPEMNGFEATALIRERDLATGGHTPIIALTAHALKGDRERCTAAGMDDYLSKPIEAQALFEVIDRVTTSEVSVNRNDQSRKPAFDASWLLANFEDDFDLIRRLADVFVEASVGQLNQIGEAIVIGDFQTVELIAHSLKGAVANFRAPAAVEAAARLESIGRGANLSNAEASFEVLKREVESLNKDLATLREVTVQ